MQTLSTIRELLAARGLRPKHRYGQNFLHDQNQLRRLLNAAAIQPGELVLEVGPGTGTLTEALVELGATVIAAELDADMAAIVDERLGERITLLRGDCLDGKHALAPALRAALGGRGFALVANLPYGAATPLMMTLLTEHPECRGQFVTIQREVADRLMAQPDRKQYGPLTVTAQVMATIEPIGTIPPSCFWPAPEVVSAMVAIRPRNASAVDDPKAFASFVQRLFAMRRKQLRAILGKAFPLSEEFNPRQRPETLDPAQLVRLWQAARAHAEGAG
ncbi:MAG TPA: 16S rRNA (adenine(1518)-N(6)/adenine(1519)-N(6))-dimethyltransferase RsmA [Phycisphaerales bacterium]|nr:16S rRNA (adenine(1518)-N(6)/adenine(1519)-N(6))-dimethyltransferase RsmA [Phycisphaerales bacterium]HMP36084.1 16S rRNA (adenine(1518)-N(6)/adenine(1519)-N(6))-dimethyltransferase RsmA [Phycisphaerales bacterium]